MWPSAGCSSSSSEPELHAAGHREPLDLSERQRRGPLHVELLVVVAQVALRRAGLAVEALHARLAQPQREPRERQPSQQVVEVRVGGEQGIGLEPRAREQSRQRLELVREVGRVDQHGFAASAQRDRVGLPHPACDDEDVRVDRDGPQAAFNSLPASRKVLTSASGFLRPSRSSPCRFTQITGIFDFRHGSTSVG